MEYTNKKQIENLLRLKSFHNLKVQVSLHASLNTCKCVVRFPDLKGVSEEEILEEMKEQVVIHVRRIKVRRDDAFKGTNTLVFTSNTRDRSGGGMALGKLPVPGRLTVLITVEQGPIALALGTGGEGGGVGNFYCHLSFLLFLPLIGRRLDID